MIEETIPKKIVDAVKSEDCSAIRRILGENPDQVIFFTPFGGSTWLGYAAQLGKLESMKALMECGIDVNTGDKRENVKPICDAANNGHADVVEFLIENGSDLDVSLSVRNPLFSAIVGRSPSCVRLILDAGIDSGVVYNSDTMTGMDAVAFALMRGEYECANLIAEHKLGGNTKEINEYLRKADAIATKNAYS